jgi:hypothetical protein
MLRDEEREDCNGSSLLLLKRILGAIFMLLTIYCAFRPQLEANSSAGLLSVVIISLLGVRVVCRSCCSKPQNKKYLNRRHLVVLVLAKDTKSRMRDSRSAETARLPGGKGEATKRQIVESLVEYLGWRCWRLEQNANAQARSHRYQDASQAKGLGRPV